MGLSVHGGLQVKVRGPHPLTLDWKNCIFLIFLAQIRPLKKFPFPWKKSLQTRPCYCQQISIVHISYYAVVTSVHSSTVILFYSVIDSGMPKSVFPTNNDKSFLNNCFERKKSLNVDEFDLSYKKHHL